MTSDLCSEDVVVCIASPQVISTEGGARAASSAAVELGRRLLLAARAGNTAQVLDLMAKGAPFTTDWLGTSPLHLAATNNHVETCAVLLRAGVSRDSRTKVERTPLHLAAYAGHCGVVQLLLQHDAAVDCRDMLRMTPLHWAAQRGHEQVVSALLDAGCELAPVSKFGKTPRQLAVAAEHARVAALLDFAASERQQRRAASVSVSAAEAAPAAWRARGAQDGHTDSAGDTQPAAQGFHPIHRLQEIKATNTKVKPQQAKTSTNESKTETNNSSSGSDTAAQLLRRHGITLLPADDGSTVLSALQSGRTVVLSDAGKLMLKESSPPHPAPAAPAPTPAPAPPASPSKGIKLFTLNNKLLLNNKTLGKNLANVQLSQVKFVQLKDKLSARRGTPVKIVVNRNAGPPTPDKVQTSDKQPADAGVPEDSAALRSQLQAARKAVAALTAELACCKARLAALEQRQA